MPEVVRSIEIQAPPSVVWRWMATAQGLRRWISPGLEIDLQVGGRYRIDNGAGEPTITGAVLEIVPEGALVLSWFEEGAEWLHPSRLVVTLSPTASGTTVRLAHDGFAGIGKPGWPDTAQAYERGADRHKILQRLAELVATHGADVQ
jgi:uncharacterized protein YndB with AHSA1/START domain